MNVLWLPRARQNIAEIYKHIATDSPAAARLVIDRLYNAGMALGIPILTKRGRPGRVPGTRELVVPKTSCIIAYRALDDHVEILAIIHSKRRWPSSF